MKECRAPKVGAAHHMGVALRCVIMRGNEVIGGVIRAFAEQHRIADFCEDFIGINEMVAGMKRADFGEP